MWAWLKRHQDKQYSEVLDDQGHKTGELLERKIVHDRELWHEVVNVWIIDSKGQVLLQLRAPEVDICPNVWDVAVGTHVRPTEEPMTAAKRCLRSELGIEIVADNLKHLFNIQAANPIGNGKKHKVLGHVFLLKYDLDLADVTLDSKKITKLVWKPLTAAMAEVGSTDTASQYFPREGTYYPQVFEALQAEMPSN